MKSAPFSQPLWRTEWQCPDPEHKVLDDDALWTEAQWIRKDGAGAADGVQWKGKASKSILTALSKFPKIGFLECIGPLWNIHAVSIMALKETDNKPTFKWGTFIGRTFLKPTEYSAYTHEQY